VGVMGGGAGGVARVIGACSCQYGSGSVSCLLCTGRVAGTWRHTRHSLRRLGQKAYQVLAAHGRLRRGGGTRSAAVTAYAVGESAVSRAASLTVSVWERAWSDEGSAMRVGRRWGVLAGRGCVLVSPARRLQRVCGCSRVSEIAGWLHGRALAGLLAVWCRGSSGRVSKPEFFVLGAVFLYACLGRHRLFFVCTGRSGRPPH
jgi:hypothetical protein